MGTDEACGQHPGHDAAAQKRPTTLALLPDSSSQSGSQPVQKHAWLTQPGQLQPRLGANPKDRAFRQGGQAHARRDDILAQIARLKIEAP